jgi:hypothetical protein
MVTGIATATGFWIVRAGTFVWATVAASVVDASPLAESLAVASADLVSPVFPAAVFPSLALPSLALPSLVLPSLRDDGSALVLDESDAAFARESDCRVSALVSVRRLEPDWSDGASRGDGLSAVAGALSGDRCGADVLDGSGGSLESTSEPKLSNAWEGSNRAGFGCAP